MVNESEDSWATLSWLGRPELAGGRGRRKGLCPSPAWPEACSREVMSQWECSKMWNLKQLLAGSPFFCSRAP